MGCVVVLVCAPTPTHATRAIFARDVNMFRVQPIVKELTNDRSIHPSIYLSIEQVEKTESFFKFFQNPVMYDDDDEEEEEDEEVRQTERQIQRQETHRERERGDREVLERRARGGVCTTPWTIR